LMKAVGYRGPLDIGYKYDARSGQYKAIDVNPRIGRTFRLLVDTIGMDVARALYLDLTGQPVVTGQLREGRKWVVENFDLLSSPRYCRDGKINPWQWIRTYRDVEEAAWFARDDLAPFIAMGRSSFRWGVEKLLAKVGAVSKTPIDQERSHAAGDKRQAMKELSESAGSGSVASSEVATPLVNQKPMKA
jgi:predicted ATP-grasp superfamily ATP-dependent carboligase